MNLESSASISEALRLIADAKAEQQARDRVRVMAKEAERNPLAEAEIGKGKPGPGRGKKTDREPTRFKKRDSEYLTRRIARDRPDILERMKAGEFTSVRAAAKERQLAGKNLGANLHQPPNGRASDHAA